jgi:hypothetical protein
MTSPAIAPGSVCRPPVRHRHYQHRHATFTPDYYQSFPARTHLSNPGGAARWPKRRTRQRAGTRTAAHAAWCHPACSRSQVRRSRRPELADLALPPQLTSRLASRSESAGSRVSVQGTCSVLTLPSWQSHAPGAGRWAYGEGRCPGRGGRRRLGRFAGAWARPVADVSIRVQRDLPAVDGGAGTDPVSGRTAGRARTGWARCTCGVAAGARQPWRMISQVSGPIRDPPWPYQSRRTTAGNRERALRTGGGGQGQDRTVDLPLFRRTIAPEAAG